MGILWSADSLYRLQIDVLEKMWHMNGKSLIKRSMDTSLWIMIRRVMALDEHTMLVQHFRSVLYF